MKVVREFRGEYRFLSNFYLVDIEYAKQHYPSVENAYQAAKTKDKKLRVKFETIPPSDAKRLGRKIPLRDDWEDIKRAIMHTLVRSKFENDFALRAQLLATGDARLEEGNWWGDRYWGMVDGEGENHLGKILMRVRRELMI